MHVFVLRDDVHKDFLCVWLAPAPLPGHLSLCSPSLYALSGHLVHPITRHLIIIIFTRPKPAYGRQGLARSWGQDTDKVSNF